jgi:hypothetical protein
VARLPDRALDAAVRHDPAGGRFREDGRWSFLDVDDRERAVVIDLTGHGYSRVVLSVDDPEAFAANLRERRPERG